MKKNLPFFGLLLGLLLGNISLMAADFTVSGKVSLVQESVPLPFYEVSIADGEGKYVATVKTSFSGKYSHTFDIPEDEKVQFEVSVIDRCTGNPLIEAFEKEGTKIKANFLVCDPSIITGEEETDGNENEGDDDKEDDEDGGFGGLPDFLNCEALGLDIAVCVVEDNGNVTTYSNACAALDSGIKLNQLTLCDGLPDVDGGGLGIGGGFGCDQLGFDLPINVCVTNAEGEALNLPLCDALAEGYPVSQIEFCEELSGLGGLDSLDCEGLGINLPVCGTDTDGNEMTFNNPCEALAAGFELNQLSICGDILDGGLGGILDNFDCDNLANDVPVTVCVTNEAGETEELQICDALTSGLSFDELAFCDGGMGLLDSLDCEELGINVPICGTDADGNEVTFNNPCEALDAGFELNQLSICGDILDGGLGGILDNFDCESLGLSIDIPVCTTNEAGEQVELMLCDALTQGISLDNVDLCEGALDDIDCVGLGISLPVCALDATGNAITFANPCDALAAGIALNELTFCQGLIDSVLESVDCNAFDFELPIPVCVTNELGEQVELDLCDALSQGIGVNNIEICASTIAGIGADDCEGLGLNIPVCAVDANGNKVEYANPCEALAAGLNIEELSFCDDLLEDVMAAAFSTTATEEETIAIEKATLYPNPASNQIVLNLEFTENTAYEVNVLSMNGNAIYRQKYNALNGANVTNMDVSSLGVGIYLLQVVTPRGIKTMKFVKQ